MPADLSMKILVVDDFATMRRIISNVLRQLGFEDIVEAEDGAKALKVLDSEKIDFVITDWNMPEMSGMDLLKAIRTKSDKDEMPVMMVTAEALQENILAAAQAGVNNYIVKPFDAATLSDKINKIFP
ncbi:MAG: response regulator [SAR324 cluster bacterium]|nr:response regulator [SAR324 cluster bacterium]